MVKKKFCPKCGEWIAEPSPHTWKSDYAHFLSDRCPKCGTPLTDAPPAGAEHERARIPDQVAHAQDVQDKGGPQRVSVAGRILGTLTSLFGRPKSEVHQWPRSERVQEMHELMEQAKGSTTLRPANLELFNGASASEQVQMAAIVWNRGAQVLAEVTSCDNARVALSRVANIFDGVPGQEVMVEHFRRLASHPDAMNDWQWIELCRNTARDWAKQVPRFIELAKNLKGPE